MNNFINSNVVINPLIKLKIRKDNKIEEKPKSWFGAKLYLVATKIMKIILGHEFISTTNLKTALKYANNQLKEHKANPSAKAFLPKDVLKCHLEIGKIEAHFKEYLENNLKVKDQLEEVKANLTSLYPYIPVLINGKEQDIKQLPWINFDELLSLQNIVVKSDLEQLQRNFAELYRMEEPFANFKRRNYDLQGLRGINLLKNFSQRVLQLVNENEESLIKAIGQVSKENLLKTFSQSLILDMLNESNLQVEEHKSNPSQPVFSFQEAFKCYLEVEKIEMNYKEYVNINPGIQAQLTQLKDKLAKLYPHILVLVGAEGKTIAQLPWIEPEELLKLEPDVEFNNSAKLQENFDTLYNSYNSMQNHLQNLLDFKYQGYEGQGYAGIDVLKIFPQLVVEFIEKNKNTFIQGISHDESRLNVFSAKNLMKELQNWVDNIEQAKQPFKQGLREKLIEILKSSDLQQDFPSIWQAIANNLEIDIAKDEWIKLLNNEVFKQKAIIAVISFKLETKGYSADQWNEYLEFFLRQNPQGIYTLLEQLDEKAFEIAGKILDAKIVKELQLEGKVSDEVRANRLGGMEYILFTIQNMLNFIKQHPEA